MQRYIRAFLEIAFEELPLKEPAVDFRACAAEEDALEALATCDAIVPVAGEDPLSCWKGLAPARGSARTICARSLSGVRDVAGAFELFEYALAPGGILLAAASLKEGARRGSNALCPHRLMRHLRGAAALIVAWQGPDSQPHSVFAVTAKHPVSASFATASGNFVGRWQSWLEGAAGAAHPDENRLNVVFDFPVPRAALNASVPNS